MKTEVSMKQMERQIMLAEDEEKSGVANAKLYARGVRDALKWVIGDTDNPPMGK